MTKRPDDAAAVRLLLADIRIQYERRVLMYRDAGGSKPLQGSLTAYLDYAMLQKVFPDVES